MPKVRERVGQDVGGNVVVIDDQNTHDAGLKVAALGLRAVVLLFHITSADGNNLVA